MPEYGDPSEHWDKDFRYGFGSNDRGPASEYLRALVPAGQADQLSQLNQMTYIRSHASAKRRARILGRQISRMKPSDLASPLLKQVSPWSKGPLAMVLEEQLVNSIGGRRTQDVVTVATAGQGRDSLLRQITRAGRGGSQESDEFRAG